MWVPGVLGVLWAVGGAVGGVHVGKLSYIPMPFPVPRLRLVLPPGPSRCNFDVASRILFCAPFSGFFLRPTFPFCSASVLSVSWFRCLLPFLPIVLPCRSPTLAALSHAPKNVGCHSFVSGSPAVAAVCKSAFPLSRPPLPSYPPPSAKAQVELRGAGPHARELDARRSTPRGQPLRGIPNREFTHEKADGSSSTRRSQSGRGSSSSLLAIHT